MAAFRASNGSAMVFAAIDKWSQKSSKYNAQNTANKWAEFFRYPPTDIGAGTIFYMAMKAHEARCDGDDNSVLLAAMNEKYFVAREGGKTWVITFERERNRFLTVYMKFPDFTNLLMNQLVKITDRDGNTKYIEKGKWWLHHKNRRQYEGLTFEPGNTAQVIEGRYNLWRGWGVESKRGCWKLMRKHIWLVLADKDKERFKYIMRWLAWSMQHPDQRAEVALVFKGKRGTGKGTLGNCMMVLFGQHSHQVSAAKHLTGTFNAHMR